MSRNFPRIWIQNSAVSFVPALNSERIRSTVSTLFGGWQFCTRRPMTPGERGKIRSGEAE